MSDYYTASSDPADNTDATPDVLRAEHALIAAGFTKIAPYTGHGNEFCVINVGATAQTSITAAAARTLMGLAIGTNVQAWDADLDAIAALTSAADKLPYSTGAQAWALTSLTAAGRSLIGGADASAQLTTLGFSAFIKALVADVDAATARTTIGLGTLATQSGTFSGTSSGTNTGDQTAATQADQELGAATTVFVSPARQQHHKSAAKYWILADGASAGAYISYNVSGTTDTGTGIMWVSFATAFSGNDQHCAVVSVDSSTNLYGLSNVMQSTIDVIECRNTGSGSKTDPNRYSVVGFGDQ